MLLLSGLFRLALAGLAFSNMVIAGKLGRAPLAANRVEGGRVARQACADEEGTFCQIIPFCFGPYPVRCPVSCASGCAATTDATTPASTSAATSTVPAATTTGASVEPLDVGPLGSGDRAGGKKGEKGAKGHKGKGMGKGKAGKAGGLSFMATEPARSIISGMTVIVLAGIVAAFALVSVRRARFQRQHTEEEMIPLSAPNPLTYDGADDDEYAVPL